MIQPHNHVVYDGTNFVQWKNYCDGHLMDVWKYYDGRAKDQIVRKRLRNNKSLERSVRINNMNKTPEEVDDVIKSLDLDYGMEMNEDDLQDWDEGDIAAKKRLIETVGPEFKVIVKNSESFRDAYDSIVRTRLSAKRYSVLYSVIDLLNLTLKSMDDIHAYIQRKSEFAESVRSVQNKILNDDVVDWLHAAALVVGIPDSMELLRRSLEDAIEATGTDDGKLNPKAIEQRLYDELARQRSVKRMKRNFSQTGNSSNLHCGENSVESKSDSERGRKKRKVTCRLCHRWRHTHDNCFWNPESDDFDSEKAKQYRKRKKETQGYMQTLS